MNSFNGKLLLLFSDVRHRFGSEFESTIAAAAEISFAEIVPKTHFRFRQNNSTIRSEFATLALAKSRRRRPEIKTTLMTQNRRFVSKRKWRI